MIKLPDGFQFVTGRIAVPRGIDRDRKRVAIMFSWYAVSLVDGETPEAELQAVEWCLEMLRKKMREECYSRKGPVIE